VLCPPPPLSLSLSLSLSLFFLRTHGEVESRSRVNKCKRSRLVHDLRGAANHPRPFVFRQPRNPSLSRAHARESGSATSRPAIGFLGAWDFCRRKRTEMKSESDVLRRRRCNSCQRAFFFLISGDTAPVRHLSLKSLLPETDGYMTYEGSTTHPGCWETAIWLILNKPIYITAREVNIDPPMIRCPALHPFVVPPLLFLRPLSVSLPSL